MIPVLKPSISNQEIKEVTKTIQSGWWGCGPRVAEFEKKIGNYIGTKYPIAVSNCTSALHLALIDMGLPEGSEIITTPITFISTALVAKYCGLKIIFADIEKNTLNIDVKDIEKKITKNTKAIIVVHFAGNPVDMDSLLKISKKYNLRIIEDCAHAMGTYYKGKHVGTFGDYGCFSFHAVKNLAMGDGGLIIADNKKSYDKIMKLRWLGINKDTHKRAKDLYSWEYDIDEVGYKYQMNDIVASLGIAQLERINKLNEKRKRNCDYYKKKLSIIEWIDFLEISEGNISSNHLFVVKIRKTEIRNKLMDFLKKHSISVGLHYKPLFELGVFKGYNKNPVASKIWRHIMTLPNYPDMSINDLKYICDCVLKFDKEFVKKEVEKNEK